MKRREFVLGGAAAAVLPSRIIDTHTHFYDPFRPQGVPWPKPAETALYRRVLPDEFQRLAKPLGVAGTVVVEASPWVEDNQWILDLARDDPFLVGLVGNLPVGKPEFREHLVRFRKNPLFLGIRVGLAAVAKGRDNSAWAADVKRLADAGLEMDVLGPWSMLADLARFSDRFPNLRIVINHLPGDLREQAGAALAEFAGRPQVYAKVSWVLRRVEERTPLELSYYKESLDAVWDVFGADRVIYGSNWPVSNLEAPYAAVHKVVADYFASKGPEAVEKYFWRNSEKAYQWVKR